MEKEIGIVVQKYIDEFHQEIVKRNKKLNMEEVQQIWKKVSGTTSKSVGEIMLNQPKKKKSAYQNFFAEIRKKITEENPGIKFGEISKEVSKKWKDLSIEEKKQFNVEATFPNEIITDEQSIIVQDNDDDELLFEENTEKERTSYEDDEESIDEIDDTDFCFEEE